MLKRSVVLSMQLCTGIGASIEGAVHALNEVCEKSQDGWCVY